MVMAVDVIHPDPAEAPRRISVLGSTGSIGTNTLDLVRRNDGFRIVALTAQRNVELLAAQAREFGAQVAVIGDPELYRDLKSALAGTEIMAAAGPAAIVEASGRPSDLVMAAIVGAAGLEATYAALSGTSAVALANKECLVAAGAVFKHEVARTGTRLLPVDSEHSAIFQVLDGDRPETVERIILTASGGPFRTWTADAIAAARPQDALAHPIWSMGAKISIDSATMMNKGLELIEAHHLFDVGSDQLEVLVHPQSIVHSMVAYRDGSVLAQLGWPDMRTPISVALAWPDRMDAPVPTIDLAKIGTLTFEAPDVERFPALGLARAALEAGGIAPIVLNAANEVAVEAYLGGHIGFSGIVTTVADCLEAAAGRGLVATASTIDEVLEVDHDTRCLARTMLPPT